MRVGVAPDVDEQRGVVDDRPRVVVEAEPLGDAQRDQGLPQHVLHRLPEAEVDPERERRDELGQPDGRSVGVGAHRPRLSDRIACVRVGHVFVRQCNTKEYTEVMPTSSFSARLDSRLVVRLKNLSAREGITASQLAERFIEEGVCSAELPGIVFRPGPTGRRAGLHGGPDVWEVVRDVQHARARGARDPIEIVVRSTDLSEDQVRLALAYHSRYPGDVDERIAAAEELERALAAQA